MKVRCDIKGLDCPHCAARLEDLLRREFGGASLNFTAGTLVLEAAEDADEDEIVERARGIAAGFENGIAIELRD